MKVDSQEYKDLMAKWSREAYAEEMNTAWESHLEYEDAMGQKRDNTPKKCTEGSNHVY